MDEINRQNRKYFIICFRFFEYLYFFLSIAGAVLAVNYVQTGTLFSVVSTIESKITEKFKNYLQDKSQKEKGLAPENLLTKIQQLEQKLEQVENDEFKLSREIQTQQEEINYLTYPPLRRNNLQRINNRV